ncbi:winged helix-turn-helix domain-containing protein [Lysobacter capsici]|uniref:winged helix-turn-helix transcriptional regulator n=1 Tax=Lysobacter capsici TaxID=435897 RepID=UPI00177C3729|nr:winged helix-turn-helix transcriptional regulator [Lysobacter capsici]UOF14379.1 winged helix-turn-helix domain-containing protein [Lysobacter capsici]
MADAAPSAPVAGRYALADLIVDTVGQRVERDGVALKVSGLSFQLLAYLIAQGDRVVGFDELIEQVWAPAVVNEETVTQRVKLLRQAMGDDGRDPRYLRSVRGRGYQLCVRPERLRDAPEAIPADEPVSEPVSGPADPSPSTTRRLAPWIAAVALLSLAGIGIGVWHSRSATLPAAAPIATTPQSLTQRAEYYASLGQRDNNERAIALYQQALQETPRDRAAQVGLSRAYSARVCLFNFAPEWAVRAQTLAQAAIAADPNDAAAYAALGYSHDCRGRLNDALAGYEQALRLDPTNDATRASAAYLYDRKGRLADALIANTSLRGDPARVRFLQLQIASNLDLLGYPQAAEARYRESFRLYPDNVFSNIAWPRFLFRHGRLTEARRALDQALQRGTEHADLHLLAGELALVRGDRKDAATAFARAAALRPQASLPRTLVDLYGSPAKPEALRDRANESSEYLQKGAGYPSDWLEVALLHAGSGDSAAALLDVQRAVDEGYRDADYLGASPLFRPLAAHPEFARSLDLIHQRVADQNRQVPRELLARLTASP